MANSAKDNSITLNLTDTTSPSALPQDALLHKAQSKRFFQNIDSTIHRITSFIEKLHHKPATQMGYMRVHDVITLHGKRGSGKTTFLLSALQLLKDSNAYRDYTARVSLQTSFSPDDLCVLEIMDPTLFAQREHLLLIILSQMAKKIKEHQNRSNACACTAGDACSVEEWHKKLARLAKGLKSVGEIREDYSPTSSKEPRWEDAEFILQHDLDNAQNSMDLEQKFHEITYHALKILQKKAFVLALDDTDTRPRIGWHILEVLRRYFTTPQLIVVLSGDIDLFSTIIRQRHIEELGFQSGDSQIDAPPFKARIDDLTEQYLLKILRSQNRINIGTFWSALPFEKTFEESFESVTVRKDTYGGSASNVTEPCTLHDLLDTFASDIGCTAKAEKDLFVKALLNQSCRTVVQILDGLFDRTYNLLTQSEFAFRLCEIFFNQLQSLGFSPYELQEQLETTHGVTLLMDAIEALEKNEISLDLLPKYLNKNYNEAIIALQACLQSAIAKNPSVFFSYMLQACLLREIQDTPEMQSVTYTEIHSYLFLNIVAPLHKIVQNIAPLSWLYLRGKEPLSKYGTLRLSGESIWENASDAVEDMYGHPLDRITLESCPKELKTFYTSLIIRHPQQYSVPLVNLINTPRTLYDNIQSWHRDIVHIGFVKIKSANAEYPTFSVFALLAVLGDILACSDSEKLYMMLQAIASLYKFSDFSTGSVILDTKKGVTTGSMNQTNDIGWLILDERETNEIADSFDSDASLFFHALREWRRSMFFQNRLLTVTLSSRIMARFFVVLQRISDGFTDEEIFLGAYIHRCLVAFFNSAIIEEVLLRDDLQGIRKCLSIDTTRKNDELFCDNLELLYNHCNTEEGLEIEDTFFYLVFTCPLWKFYLNSTTDSPGMLVTKWYQKIVKVRKKENGFFPTHLPSAQEKFVMNDENSFSFYHLFNSIAIPKDIPKYDVRTELGKFLNLPRKPEKINYTSVLNDLFSRGSQYLNTWIKEGEFVEDPPSRDFVDEYADILSLYYKDEKIIKDFSTAENILAFWYHCAERLRGECPNS